MDGTITVLDKIETQNIEVLNSGDDENKIIPLFIYSGIVILLIIIYYRVRISGIERL
jgi:1-acyl-sn-glycerol-3-phosphate acyltransferase